MAKGIPLPPAAALPKGADLLMDDDDNEVSPYEDDADGEFEEILQEDGSSIIREISTAPAETDFYDNLAEDVLSDNMMSSTAYKLLDLIKDDILARKERDRQQAEGIRRTGLGDEAPGGADFEGASKVVHPSLVQAGIEFSARAMKELWPVSGPVKMKVDGEPTKDKLQKADRKTRHMNRQLTIEMPEYREELEQMLTQLPLGGSQFLYFWHDDRLKRNRAEFLPVDDVILPFLATSWKAAFRKAIRRTLTEQQYQDRVRSGLYRDVDLAKPSQMPEQTESQKATEKIEGKSDPGGDDSVGRVIYDVYIYMSCDGEDAEAPEDMDVPYVVMIEENSSTVIGWYRNWEEGDDTFVEMDWVVEFKMIPWRGAYGIGLPHIIGGLSAAQTGALRALLDSAHINNVPTMLKLKGANIGGQSITVSVTEVTEIDGGLNVDDIRKVAMPMPFNPPSAVLFNLLGYLDSATKGAIRTSMDDSAIDSNMNTPVGTQLSRVEQGMMVFSSIHARLHESQRQCFAVLHRLNRLYLPEKVKLGKELFVYRRDYDGPLDVAPVSDPSIFSEQQRYAQLQAVRQISAMSPGQIDQRALVKRELSQLKVPDWEELLTKIPEPEEQNAVNENISMSMSRPVQAFPAQDHLAHIQVHLSYYQSPMFGQNPLIAPSLVPLLASHIKEHLTLWYLNANYDLLTEASGVPAEELFGKTEEEKRQLDQVLAMATKPVLDASQRQLAKVMPVVMQIYQQAQQFKPQGPMDPSQVAMAEVQRKQQKDQIDAQIAQVDRQIEQMKSQTQHASVLAKAEHDKKLLLLEEQKLQLERENEILRQEAENARARAANETRVQTNTQDNLTAFRLAQMEIDSGERVAVSTGTGINPSP